MYNGSHITDEHLELLKSLGEENVNLIFQIMGGKKFTIKPLMYHIKKTRILNDFKETNKSIKEIAKENNISENTVYRAIVKFKKIKANKLQTPL